MLWENFLKTRPPLEKILVPHLTLRAICKLEFFYHIFREFFRDVFFHKVICGTENDFLKMVFIIMFSNTE